MYPLVSITSITILRKSLPQGCERLVHPVQWSQIIKYRCVQECAACLATLAKMLHIAQMTFDWISYDD